MKAAAFIPLGTAIFLATVSHLMGGPRGAGNFSRVRLGPVSDPVNLVVPADRRHVAYVMPSGDKKQVFFDGQPVGPEFDGVFMESSFVLSSEGGRMAYAIVKEDKDKDCTTCGPQGKWRAVIDGKAGRIYDGVHGLTFSPDGKHVVYAAVVIEGEQHQWHLVLDGQEMPIPYEAISRESPAFTPDGKRLVYIAKKGEKAVVVVDGVEGPAYDRIAHSIPVFSSDGKRMAYTARNFDGPDGGKEMAIVDGKPGLKFDHIPAQSLIFSPDGRRIAYGGQTGGVVPGDPSEWNVVVDGKAGPSYEQVDNIVFSRDGAHVAYKAKRGGKWLLVVDGKPTSAYEELAEDFPVFSPDGTRIAYGVKDRGKWRVVVDVLEPRAGAAHLSGSIGGEYDNIGLIAFSPDGKRLAFGGKKANKRMVVVDGKPGPEHDAVENILFSPDGTRVAYEAATYAPKESDRSDRWFVVVDGQANLDYEMPVRGSLQFSLDGKHVAYAVIDRGQQHAIIDGVSGPGYKTICNLAASGRNGFEAIVVGDQLYRMAWQPDFEKR